MRTCLDRLTHPSATDPQEAHRRAYDGGGPFEAAGRQQQQQLQRQWCIAMAIPVGGRAGGDRGGDGGRDDGAAKTRGGASGGRQALRAAGGFGRGAVWILENTVRSIDWCFIPPADDPIAVIDIKPTIPYIRAANLQMTDYHLRLMPFPDLFRLFHTLPAPSGPLEGEYLAEMLDNGNVLANVLAWASFSPLYPGRWVGKVIKQQTDRISLQGFIVK